MKKIAFVLAVLAIASCARQRLNYQSSHENTGNQDNTPVPQAQSSGGGGYQGDYNSSNNNNIDYGSPSYQTFYDELSPYGTWVNYPNYGYAWVPNAGQGFSPYGTNGNWVYTSYGWTWNSGYDWGWAPFHYGRWFQDPSYGWMWVPGNQWAPAWVSWGAYNGYYGWAPVEPGVLLTSGYSPPVNYWRFVPAQNIASVNVVNYTAANLAVAHGNIAVINNSSSYEEHTYSSGPEREAIEKATGTKINTVIVHETDKPTTSINNHLNLYRPVIAESTAHKAAPAKVAPIETLKPVKNKTQSGSDAQNGVTTRQPVEQNNHDQMAPERTSQPAKQPASNSQHNTNNNKPAHPANKPAPKPKPIQPPAQTEPKKN